MLAIEEQIKKLQRVKAKIDLYTKVQANISAEQANKDPEALKLDAEHPGLMKEFCAEISAFCTDRVGQLGSGDAPRPRPTEHGAVLDAPTQPEAPRVRPPIISQAEMDEPQDPLRFMMKYKHLAGKKVKVKTVHGDVEGVVRGVTVPFIKVETETGFVVDSLPKDIIPIKEA